MGQIVSFANSFITWLTLIGWLVIILLIAFLQFNNAKKRKGIFAFKITGKILSLFHFNNPDIFPELNETALKELIKKKISNTPFREIISKIFLYRSNVHGFKYHLIVEAPEYHKGFENIKVNWDTTESPFEDDFLYIYREKSKGNYRSEWTCSVTDLDPQLEDAMVVKSGKWELYTNKSFKRTDAA